MYIVQFKVKCTLKLLKIYVIVYENIYFGSKRNLKFKILHWI